MDQKSQEFIRNVLGSGLMLFILVLGGYKFFVKGTDPDNVLSQLFTLLGPVIGFYFGAAPVASAHNAALEATRAATTAENKLNNVQAALGKAEGLAQGMAAPPGGQQAGGHAADPQSLLTNAIDNIRKAMG